VRLAFVLVLAACGGSSEVDAGFDAGRVAIDAGRDDGGAIDSGMTGDDAGMSDAGMTDDDAGMTDAGMSATDAGMSATDAGSTSDLGPVACRDSTECGAGQICDVDAPGGRCQLCEGTCVSSDFECLFGGCLRSCSGDADCNAGMRCASFAESTYCRPRSCGDCPAPYTCRDGECSRPTCGAGGACPSPLECRGSVCVEP
jgi:hypothetical protein